MHPSDYTNDASSITEFNETSSVVVGVYVRQRRTIKFYLCRKVFGTRIARESIFGKRGRWQGRQAEMTGLTLLANQRTAYVACREIMSIDETGDVEVGLWVTTASDQRRWPQLRLCVRSQRRNTAPSHKNRDTVSDIAVECTTSNKSRHIMHGCNKRIDASSSVR